MRGGGRETRKGLGCNDIDILFFVGYFGGLGFFQVVLLWLSEFLGGLEKWLLTTYSVLADMFNYPLKGE